MQAWWAAGSVMLTQGSSACACAGKMPRDASAMAAAAAADTPIIALFISSSFPDPPNGRVVVATKAAPLFGANMLVVAAPL